LSLNTILATAPLTATGYHLKATGTALGQSLIWDNGTNVGIGNQGTTYTLDVSGTGRFTTALTIGSTESTWNLASSTKLQIQNSILAGYSTTGTFLGMNLTYNSAAWKYISTGFGSLYSQDSGAHTFFTTDSGTAAATATINAKVTITNAGYTLIGATSSTGTGASRLQITGATAQLLVSNTTSTGHIALYSTGVDAYITKQTASGFMYFGLAPQDGSTFTSQMAIANTGNIGIGTSNQPFKLSVAQDITNDTGDINVGQFMVCGATTNNKRLVIGYDTNGDGYGYIESAYYTSTWTYTALQPTAGSVVIGKTTNDGSKLQVNGTTQSNGYQSYKGSISIGAGGTSTIYTMTGDGVYYVYCRLNGGSAIYQANAIVSSLISNGESFISNTRAGANVAISVSGSAIRITNGGFGTFTWQWSILFQPVD